MGKINLYPFLIISLFILSVILLNGCAPKYSEVPNERVYIRAIIKPGDTVRITTKDNKEFEFIVVDVTRDAIVGEAYKVLITEIYKIKEMTASSGKRTFNIITWPLLLL